MLPTGPGRRAPFPPCPRPSSCPVGGWPPPDHPGRCAAPGATGTLDREAAAKGAPGPAVPRQLNGARSELSAGGPGPGAPRPSLHLTTEHPNHWPPEERPLKVRSLSNRLNYGPSKCVHSGALRASTPAISLGWAVGTRSWRNSRQAVSSAIQCSRLVQY